MVAGPFAIWNALIQAGSTPPLLLRLGLGDDLGDVPPSHGQREGRHGQDHPDLKQVVAASAGATTYLTPSYLVAK